MQIPADPSVRPLLCQQARTANELDARLDEVLGRVGVLMLRHGVFHAKVHFSTGQVALCLLHDPLRYRVHVREEFLDPKMGRAYRCIPYPEEALVPSSEIPRVLAKFKRLRMQDDQIYLHAASFNVVNGLVGLNFSCEGSHYLSYAEFLTRTEELYS